MSTIFYTAKSGSVKVPVWKCRQIKIGKRYTYYAWNDYSDQTRKSRTSEAPETTSTGRLP